jgi:N-methylhydantoinase A
LRDGHGSVAVATRGRIAIDIGGTFTDAVWFEDGVLRTAKVPSIPQRQDDSVLAAVERLGASLASVDDFIHGTTAALNALLERRGARLAMLVTRGFRDVYEIGRANRPEMYDIHWRRPPMLLRRRDIHEVAERRGADGAVLEELDEEAVRGLVRGFTGRYDAVAVCLLHAHVDAAHELRVAEIVREEAPELVVVCSHEIAPEWREYERWSSTLVSAYVTPVIAGYLSRLAERLAGGGLEKPLFVMQSNGGITSAALAVRRAANTLFSGPVGGTIAGVEVGRQLDADRLICVDMGGTSFDVSLVAGGGAEVESQIEVAGHPLLTPSVDVTSLGAGGGSIAYVESGGLRVGPESAGAQPGPACYGRGGTRPTVTDANLVLGRIPADARLGATVELDRDAATAALAPVAAELGLEPLELAEGIVAVTNAKMADAIREVTVARGIDPREFDLLAFGGAGPLHAVALAEELDIARVVVPAGPGTLSAWGMLHAPIRHDFVRAFFRPLAGLDDAEVAGVADELVAEGERTLRAEGLDDGRIGGELSVDLRYSGQEYTLNVPLDGELARSFTEAHEARYGHANPNEAIEVVNVRAAALGLAEPLPLLELTAAEPEPEAQVETIFDATSHDTALYRREALGAGSVVAGPCIVLEDGCTTLVPPGWHGTTTTHGHLVLERANEEMTHGV